MELYTGSVLKMFIVDRLAMGFSAEEVCQQFKTAYGQDLPQDKLAEFAQGWAADIKAREAALLDELRQQGATIGGRIEALQKQCQEIFDALVKNNQVALAERWAGQLIKQLELLAKIYGEYKTKTESTSYVKIQTENLSAIELLEKDGVVQVMDKKKLRKLLGIVDPIEKYA